MDNVRIIDIGKEYGVMTTSAAFYPSEMSLSERQLDFLKRRVKLGEDKGFDGKHMFMADQKNKDGSFKEITKEYVEEHPNGWSDIDEDILVIREDVKDVVIGQPIADCPVVMMVDPVNHVSAIGHCGAEMIDRRLPDDIANVLVNNYGSNKDDLEVYVSACVSDDWTYDNYPGFATNEDIWKDSIRLDEGKYKIDIRKTLIKMLKDNNINMSKVKFSEVNTDLDPNYYSNYRYRGKNELDKAGRNFAGLFYTDDNKENIEENNSKKM